MPSSLSTIEPAKRKQLAATLGLFAMLFLAVGAVAATGAGTAVLKVFVAVALLIAVLLALAGWGVAASVRNDRAVADERRVDEAIAEAMAAYGGIGCGHDHDPSELHVTDDPCEQDGHGADCTHTCDTCVLATLRRAPEAAAVAASPRPSPRPRPTPRP